MAANFWASSHYQVWLKEPKEEDLSDDDKKRVTERNRRNAEIFGVDCMEEDIKRLRVELAVWTSQLGRSVYVSSQPPTKLKQRVISTALVYVHRFYYYNSYKDFHPYLIAATALYLASKVEEQPITPKSIAMELSRSGSGNGAAQGRVSATMQHNITGADIVDAEYYLVEELKFNLIVFHPYRPMERLVKEFELENNLQTAYNMVNDSYRTDLCLYYAPHTIAIATLILAAIYHDEKYEAWYDSLQFHDNHRAHISQVQQVLLTLYDDYQGIEHAEIQKIIDKIPQHELVGASSLSVKP